MNPFLAFALWLVTVTLALVAGGISEADAKTVITLIAKKAVPAVTISY